MQQIAAIILFLAVNIVAFDTTFSSADRFLKRHVCKGGVDYQAARGDALLDTVLFEFASIAPAEFAQYRENIRLATLINLYNIATIKLVTDNLSKKSIRDIPSAWSRTWIDFGGKKVSLDHLEHKIIRKQFDEPRIHFALVCAAVSCPALAKSAYTPDSLDAQLTEAARIFLTDTKKNSIDKKDLRVSAIFQWYGDDFKKRYGGYQKFVLQTIGMAGTFSFKFLPYDWQLNNARCTE